MRFYYLPLLAYISYFVKLSIFKKFSTPIQNIEFHFHWLWIKIGLSKVLCVIVFCPLLFPSRGGRIQTLCSKYNMTKLILPVECPSQNLTTYGKSALIHKPSAQIAEDFNQHDIARKKITYLDINTLIYQND